MSHTPEPWQPDEAFIYGTTEEGHLVRVADFSVCEGEDEVFLPEEEATANLERACACVNAMRGVSDPETWKVRILKDLKDAITWIDEGVDQEGRDLIVGPLRAKYFTEY